MAVARGCALPGSQLQEESETVSALASLTVDVEQPFAQEDGRYGPSMGVESVARNVQTQCWHSGTFFLLLLRLRLLLSPSAFSKATDDRVYTLGCAELNFFILPGKNRAGADGSQRKRERA